MDHASPINIAINNDAGKAREIPQMYKRLENIKCLQNNFFNDVTHEVITEIQLQSNTSKLADGDGQQRPIQIDVFRNSMKIVYVAGQCLGLISVSGILQKDITKLRFSLKSRRFMYSIFITLPQVIVALTCFYSLITKRILMSTLIFSCFYVSTSISCITFVKISSKWPGLMSKLSDAKIDQYSDSNVILKCTVISIAYLTFSVVSHILRVFDRLTTINNCYSNSTDFMELYCHMTYGWLFELNFQYNKFLAILLISINMIMAFVWAYPDLFIICIALYLSSIIKQINKKIIATGGKIFPSSYWKRLREDYNRITNTIRSFDEVVNGLIFSSFANNLFFVCFHVYYLLSNGVAITTKLIGSECSNYPSGQMYGYEHSAYYIISLLFILLRLFLVALFAAEVNTASLIVAPYLYNVPSTVFCSEVERFINQIQGDTVALSGLKFFYVTREFVLSVAGTIITYELVLLQLNES